MSVVKVKANLDTEEKNLVKNENDIYSGEFIAPLKSGDYDVTVSAYDDAGNISISKKSVNVSLWHKPKTNWVATDRFNFIDYNRIKNNILYLQQFAISMWNDFNIQDMGEDITEYTAFWDVDIFNLFESNLELINENIFTQDFGVSQRFFENGPFIKWDELNRIEGAILSMNEILENQKAALEKLSFRLGNWKGIKT